MTGVHEIDVSVPRRTARHRSPQPSDSPSILRSFALKVNGWGVLIEHFLQGRLVCFLKNPSAMGSREIDKERRYSLPWALPAQRISARGDLDPATMPSCR